jgi:hypothetical protein
MVSEKQISRAVGFAKPVVTPRFGEDTSQSILAAMRNNFAILAPSVPELKAPTSQMTLRIAVDSLAFYRALPADVPQAERLDLVQSFVNSWMDGQFDRWIARKVYANRTLHLLFRRWWFWSANRVDELDGWRFQVTPPEKSLFYGVNVTRCGTVNYLVKQGTPELAPIMCRGDFHILKYLPQGIEFKRTHVIAEGGEYCDFRYYFTGR